MEGQRGLSRHEACNTESLSTPSDTTFPFGTSVGSSRLCIRSVCDWERNATMLSGCVGRLVVLVVVVVNVFDAMSFVAKLSPKFRAPPNLRCTEEAHFFSLANAAAEGD